jgi:hypothetical protein
MMADSAPVEQDVLEKNPDAAREWRVARFSELGFAMQESEALADAKQIEYTGAGTEANPRKEWSQPLDWKKVKSALDAGCDETTAWDIFL